MVWIALGGAVGANFRYWLGLWITERTAEGFPWSTFLINVSGAFVLGVLATGINRHLPPQAPWREELNLFVLIGVLGSYTTFSTFALEAHRHWTRDDVLVSLVYLFGSVTAGFLGCAVGVLIAQLITKQS